MSLYHHVRDKQAVLGGVVELSLRTRPPPLPGPVRPGRILWQLGSSAFAGRDRSPQCSPPDGRPSPCIAAQHGGLCRNAAAFFLANGMAPQDAARLLEVLFALGFGHAMLTTNYNEMRGHGVPPVRFTEARTCGRCGS